MRVSWFRRFCKLRSGWLGAVLLLWLFLDSVHIITGNSLGTRVSSPSTTDPIYIAIILWNSELYVRDFLIRALLDLSRKRKLFVSIVENGSWDDTKDALRDLDRELNKARVGRSIKMSNWTLADETTQTPEGPESGWIMTATGQKERRRIPYLAKLRNQAMDAWNQSFPYVLWLNDVVFTVCYLLGSVCPALITLY